MLAEFLATAMLIVLGNGAVANVDLKGTKAVAVASQWLEPDLRSVMVLRVMMLCYDSSGHGQR